LRSRLGAHRAVKDGGLDEHTAWIADGPRSGSETPSSKTKSAKKLFLRTTLTEEEADGARRGTGY
jgi:hypothetical protein